MNRNRWFLKLSILVVLVVLGIVRLKLQQPINVPAIQNIKYVKIVPSQGPGNIRDNNILSLDLSNPQDKQKIENILKLLKNGKYSKSEGMPASNGRSLPFLTIGTTSIHEIDIMADGVSTNKVLVSDNQHKGAFIVEAPELHDILDDLFGRADSVN